MRSLFKMLSKEEYYFYSFIQYVLSLSKREVHGCYLYEYTIIFKESEWKSVYKTKSSFDKIRRRFVLLKLIYKIKDNIYYLNPEFFSTEETLSFHYFSNSITTYLEDEFCNESLTKQFNDSFDESVSVLNTFRDCPLGSIKIEETELINRESCFDRFCFNIQRSRDNDPKWRKLFKP